MLDQMIGITERGDPVFDLSWIKWVEKGKPTILISKDPFVLHSILKSMKQLNIIVHATITGYGSTLIEPGVCTSFDALQGYRRLVDLLGEDRVVLRVDPIIPTVEGIRIAQDIVNNAVSRVRVSFLDNYDHVKERFIKFDLEPLPYSFHAPHVWRYDAWVQLGKPEICGEPNIPSTGCISEKECAIFGVEPLFNMQTQRKVCLCTGNKFELLSAKRQCKHGCLYCYWRD